MHKLYNYQDVGSVKSKGGGILSLRRLTRRFLTYRPLHRKKGGDLISKRTLLTPYGRVTVYRDAWTLRVFDEYGDVEAYRETVEILPYTSTFRYDGNDYADILEAINDVALNLSQRKKVRQHAENFIAEVDAFCNRK